MLANDNLTKSKWKRQLNLFFNIKPMLGKLIAEGFTAIASEMCRYPVSNENTVDNHYTHIDQ